MRTAERVATPGNALALFACAALLCATVPADAQTRFGIGRTATPAEVAAWNIDVEPDGRNFPPGQGSVAHGSDVYNAQCAACHGANGEGGMGDRLAGGMGTLATDKPVKTVGSYWPYATTLWDYIRRAMPFDHPGTLTNDEIYGAAAYVLFLNGIVGEQDVVDQTTLPTIQMPNRNGFVPDSRPDVPVKRKQ